MLPNEQSQEWLTKVLEGLHFRALNDNGLIASLSVGQATDAGWFTTFSSAERFDLLVRVAQKLEAAAAGCPFLLLTPAAYARPSAESPSQSC
jgi:hypothetical protein